MSTEQYTQWSGTPASNTGTPPYGAPAGITGPQLEPTLREIMATIANLGIAVHQGQGVTSMTTNSSTAFSLTTTPSYAPALGAFVAPLMNTNAQGGDTLSVNGASAYPVVYADGSDMVPWEWLPNEIVPLRFTGSSWMLQRAPRVLPGTPIWSAGSIQPPSTVAANGGTASRTGQPGLFAYLGTTWGAGDGSTTFGLPTVPGRVIAAAGSGTGLTTRALGQTLGEETHLLAVSEMPSHNHADAGHTHAVATSGFGYVAGGDGGYEPIGGGQDFNSVLAGYAQLENTGGGVAHNNIQPTIIMNCWLKT